MYLQEIKELTADAISDSVRPDNLTDEMVMAFDVTKPFTYQIVYDVEPILKWKQPYKGMKVILELCHGHITQEKSLNYGWVCAKQSQTESVYAAAAVDSKYPPTPRVNFRSC